VKVKVEQLDIDDLGIDRSYQRKLNEDWLTSKLSVYDEELIGVIEVSRRDGGGKFVIDGQHRLELVKRWRGNGKINAIVREGLTSEEEASLFAILNKERRQPTSLEIFRSELRAGDPEAVLINRIAATAGFRIYDQADDYMALRSVQSLRKILHWKNGEEILQTTLNFAARIWKSEPPYEGDPVEILKGDFIRGLASWVRENPDKITDATISKFRVVPPSVILRRANALGEGYAGGGGLRTAVVQILSIIEAKRRPES